MLSQIISNNHTALNDEMLGFYDIKSCHKQCDNTCISKKGNEIDINIINPLLLIVTSRYSHVTLITKYFMSFIADFRRDKKGMKLVTLQYFTNI